MPAATFVPWSVLTLAMDPADAATWLLALRDGTGLRAAPEATDPEPIVGSSLRWLAELAGVALDLVRRGRFLPGWSVTTAEADPVRAAWWRPAPAPADLERLTSHAATMPGVLRATIDEGATPIPDDAVMRKDRGARLDDADGARTPDGEPAVTVLERALGGLVDALIRSLLQQTIGPGRPHAQPRTNPTLRWLASLTGPIPGPPMDAPTSLVRALDAWETAAAGTARRARASFRLSPPPDDDTDGWRVDVHLQSVLDPSLQVPATAVWARRGAGAAALEQALGDPQDLLLAELGRATRLAPMLAPLLEAARPTGLDLDTAAAHAFLRDGAPVLAEAGFGVVLPSWWRAGRPPLAARATARSSSSGSNDAVARKDAIGTETLVEVDWEVLLDGQALTAADLEALAALKAPLVRVRGTWVELRPEDLDAALRLTSGPAGPGGPPSRMTAGELIGLEAGIEHRSVGLPVAEVAATGWLARIVGGAAGIATGEGARLPARRTAPAGFVGTLRPYQLDGLAWLEWMSRHGLGACLADDMGLGKTAQLIALLAAEREDGPAAGPTLVICPMSVVGNWQRELQRFAPDLRVHVHHGAGRAGMDGLGATAGGADVVITTYGLVTRDRDALAAIAWGRIVLDEAQAIKNSGARQTQAVRSLAAPSRIALTGTPIENRLSELWSLMEVLNPGLLGSAAGFRRRFAVPIEREHDTDAAARLRMATAPFILRRLKSDRSIIRDLPPKIETTVDCRLTREQATLYRAVVDDLMTRIDETEGIERRGLVLTTMLRLKQVCNHPAQLMADGSPLPGRSGKLARLDELLEEVLAEGDRALLFTQFAEFGGMVARYLRERHRREVLFLHGGTSRAERDRMVARFEGPTGPPLFVLSIKAGGTGLNLVAANHVFHLDRWWNPAVEDQATDRAYRIGQRRAVQVHRFQCTGTLEERIAAMIAAKRELAAMVVGAGEQWITELSTEELRDLVRLGADAVED